MNSEFGDHVTRSKLLARGERVLGTVEVILMSITAAIKIRVNLRLNGNVYPQSDGICCKCGKKGGQTSNDDGERLSHSSASVFLILSYESECHSPDPPPVIVYAHGSVMSNLIFEIWMLGVFGIHKTSSLVELGGMPG